VLQSDWRNTAALRSALAADAAMAGDD
jgi:hypothetical protein